MFSMEKLKKSNAKFQKTPFHQPQRTQYCTNWNKSNHSPFECRRLKPDQLETSANSYPSIDHLDSY
jgi:hypothetical protein